MDLNRKAVASSSPDRGPRAGSPRGVEGLPLRLPWDHESKMIVQPQRGFVICRAISNRRNRFAVGINWIRFTQSSRSGNPGLEDVTALRLMPACHQQTNLFSGCYFWIDFADYSPFMNDQQAVRQRRHFF